jgi:hypothetical protein
MLSDRKPLSEVGPLQAVARLDMPVLVMVSSFYQAKPERSMDSCLAASPCQTGQRPLACASRR